MIVVRTVFQTKWGKAQEVVAGFIKSGEAAQKILGQSIRARIMTDLSGPFHTVVQEIELENLAAWESIRSQMFSSQEFQQSQSNIDQYLEGGYTEYFTLEKTF